MTEQDIFGYWVKTKTRCDYCHRPVDQAYVVRDGPCMGTFCSRLHFQLASEAKETGIIPAHERQE